MGGDRLERWYQSDQEEWLIFARQGIEVEKHPKILSHLEKFRTALEPKPEGWKPKEPSEKWPGRKSGSYQWYEIQDKTSYWKKFRDEKIISTKVSSKPTFSIDYSGSFLGNTSYIIDAKKDNLFLTAILNSHLVDFYFRGVFSLKRGGYYEIQPAGLDRVPIPSATDCEKARLSVLARRAQRKANERYQLQQSITRRIPDLANCPSATKLTTRLKEWWALPDFAAFQKEVKKALKTDIPLKERNEWDSWISENRLKIETLSAEIATIEDEINAKVYALFDLTPDEIALLEANI